MQHHVSDFEFTGFGESSPYAVFAALDFVEIYQPKRKPILVTFGQPRMGNEVFSVFVQSKLEIFRVTLADDWVPSLPIRSVKRFSKWTDTEMRPNSNRIRVIEPFTHFTPEYWIDHKRNVNLEEQLNCECPLDTYPIVYKCFNTHSVKEHPECNARTHEFSYPTKILYAGKPDNFRYGPYFGKNMNNCQNLNINYISTTIFQDPRRGRQ
ncbi:hypothetical protein G9A89_012159 [Geosiphon pyriformis]|nr:hypothetical protein G9A89_012159 [Geosiphon pyriformis]